jgi:hypothetical protein
MADTPGCGELSGRDRAGVLKVEPLGCVRGPSRQDSDVLGVEATLRKESGSKTAYGTSAA